MLFSENENENKNKFEVSSQTLINLTSQITDNELEQLLSNNAEAVTESCAGGACHLNWRPSRRNSAA
jgi:hypothetical protein